MYEQIPPRVGMEGMLYPARISAKTPNASTNGSWEADCGYESAVPLFQEDVPLEFQVVEASPSVYI
jgi:hypothetical protein